VIDPDRLRAALEEEGMLAVPTPPLPDKYTMWILCEICYEVIAIADIRELCLPLKPEMFRSVSPTRDMPPPFAPGLDFEFMLCPHCRHRFAVEENRIRTQDGFYTVPEELPATEETPAEVPVADRVPETGPWFALPHQKEIPHGKEEDKSQTGKGPQGNGEKRKRGK
jgi:hypothetical protein